MMDLDTIVEITNRSDGTIILRNNESSGAIKRWVFNEKETKRMSYRDILAIASQPGGRKLLYNYCFIKNPNVIREGLNIQEEAEYWLKEEEIPEWMQKCTLDQFKDALDFAPEGTKMLIQKYAVTLPLNDFSKRQAIKEQLGFDVTAAINNSHGDASEEAAQNAQTSKRRSSSSGIDVPTETEETPKYTIIEQ